MFLNLGRTRCSPEINDNMLSDADEHMQDDDQ